MTEPEPWQDAADRLAEDALAEGRPTAWFERLYAAADGGAVTTPWDRTRPHPLLAGWVEEHLVGAGKSAVVVGCGLGADAEFLSSMGFATTAFDISPTAVALAQRRNPGSAATYLAADLLAVPPAWLEAFDLVADVFTVQAMVPALHAAAAQAASRLVAPGGTLVAIGSGVPGDHPATDGPPPYLLSRGEIAEFELPGLHRVSFDQLDVDGARRWRLVLERS